jgi:hypothetical protein
MDVFFAATGERWRNLDSLICLRLSIRLPGGGSEATDELPVEADRAKRVFRISLAAMVEDVPEIVEDRATEYPPVLMAEPALECVVDLVSNGDERVRDAGRNNEAGAPASLTGDDDAEPFTLRMSLPKPLGEAAGDEPRVGVAIRRSSSF